MVKEKNIKNNEEEAVRAFLTFRSFSSDKQAFAIAFMNGMEFQRTLDNTEDKQDESKYRANISIERNKCTQK